MNEVPYIVYESEMARLERIIRRQFLLIIIALCFLVGTNICWIVYENSFEEVVTTQEVTQDLDSENGNAIINDGVHINGESNTDGQENH